VRYDILYYGDPGNETWPSIEGLDWTVTPFQHILKYFKRRQHFVAPGDGFDAHSSTRVDEKWSEMVLQSSGEMLFEQGSFGDSKLSMLALLACKFSSCGEGMLACEWSIFMRVKPRTHKPHRENILENRSWVIACVELS
jgi:hypothetical protein